jgi:DNA-binding response OmpR family regulator
MRILIAEDEKHLAEGLRFNLEAEGYEVEIAHDGEEALGKSSAGGFDAIVLDVMMPKADGFTVARALREKDDFTPILMLTALGRPEDVLEGFAAGADDYLPKPFDLSIFLARLNGLIRRRTWLSKEAGSAAGKSKDNVLEINGRVIDFDALTLRAGDAETPLTLMEAKLLRYLADNEGKPVSRKSILEEVWGLREDTDTRAIDNFIVRLRRHLEDDPNDPRFVQTVRGVGYKLTKAS